ncbi:MAG: hypothetical protein GY849_18435, partial [Deltaproteobacteria bacterium]|nr:hypothetical protein [Deltaproteobacteria bacterium]
VNLNIFDFSGMNSEDLLVGVRIIQILSKENSKGLSVELLVNTLEKYCYPALSIKRGIETLAKYGLIRDVKEQKPWQIEDNLPLMDTDSFALASSGKYFLTKLFDSYAFRYCEAIADIMGRPRHDGQAWRSDRAVDGIVFNAMGVLELILVSGELELKRFLDKAGSDDVTKRIEALKEFKDTFHSNDVLGKDFLLGIAEGCKGMFNYFISKAYLKYSDFDTQTKIKTFQGKMRELYVKAVQVNDGNG